MTFKSMCAPTFQVYIDDDGSFVTAQIRIFGLCVCVWGVCVCVCVCVCVTELKELGRELQIKKQKKTEDRRRTRMHVYLGIYRSAQKIFYPLSLITFDARVYSLCVVCVCVYVCVCVCVLYYGKRKKNAKIEKKEEKLNK